MPGYRSYTVGNDGHFISCFDIFAADDDAAIAVVQNLVGTNDIELWRLSRRIALIAGKRDVRVPALDDKLLGFAEKVRPPSLWETPSDDAAIVKLGDIEQTDQNLDASLT